jgi:hypothetical protein
VNILVKHQKYFTQEEYMFRLNVSDTLRLMSLMEAMKIVHVYREANKVADALAKWGLNQDILSHYFDVVPNFSTSFVLADRAGSLIPRGC